MSRALDLHVFADAAALAEGAATDIAAVLTAAVAADGAASLVLTGGTTPEKIYRALATRDVPWDKISLFFGDERAVPADDEASNYNMARKSLLANLPTAPKRVERMQGDAGNLEQEAVRYGAALPERVTLLLLGVGEDGHVASLFPGHGHEGSENAHEAAPRVVVVRNSPKPPPVRLTITPAVVARAHAIFVLATGESKKDAIHDALCVPGSPLPLALARRGSFYLDAAAASRLPTEPALGNQ